MFYPEIIPPQEKDCSTIISKKFCSTVNYARGNLCGHCVDFVLTTEFAKNLLKQLKGEIIAKGFTIKITSVTWPETELSHAPFSHSLFSDFEDFFK